MKNILTYGTFDLFHIGHLKLLKNLSQLGELTVAVSTDEFNKIKGKKNLIPFEQRIEIVLGCRYVSRVIPENSWEQKIQDIKKYKIDVFAIGDDWTGKFDYLNDYCEVLYLPRTVNISSSEIKESLNPISSLDKQELLRAFEVLEILKNNL